MAQKAIKMKQLSDNINLKTKDILDAFKDIGLDKKSGASVEAAEFELLIATLTKKNQISNIDDYLDGITLADMMPEKTEETE